MSSERETPRGAASGGLSPKAGLNGAPVLNAAAGQSRKLAGLFGGKTQAKPDAAPADDKSGPAYQHLRETLRDLIGDAEPDDSMDVSEPVTQRRRGYVSPSRAGIAPPPAAAAAQQAVDAAEAKASPSIAARAEPGEPTRGAVRTGLKAKLRAERTGADAPLIRREAPVDGPGPEQRAGSRRRIEIDDETHFKTLETADLANYEGQSPGLADSMVENLDHQQDQPRGDNRQVSRLRRRRLPQKGEYAPRVDPGHPPEHVDDDELWTGRGVAIAPPRRNRSRMIAFGLGGAVLMGAGIFLGARIFTPAANAPAAPRSVAAEPAKVLPAAVIAQVPAAAAIPAVEPEPLALEPIPATPAVKPLAAEPARSVADITSETDTVSDAATGAATPAAVAEAVPAETEVGPVAADAEPEKTAEAATAAAGDSIPGISADGSDGQQPADAAVPSVAADLSAGDAPAADTQAADAQVANVPAAETPVDASALAGRTDEAPADGDAAAASDVSPASADDAPPADDAASAAQALDAPPADEAAVASPPTETKVAVLAIPPKPGSAACERTIHVQPLPAGFSRIAVDAACLGGQQVRFTYGGVVYDRQLDDAGALRFDIDCFLGAAEPVRVAFKDGAVYDAVPSALDLDKVAKIAVVWNSAVDIDLHAYEEQGAAGGGRHIWASAPGSAIDAIKLIRAEQLGAGYMSSVADAHGTGGHVEVYTFVYPLTVAAAASSGHVKFAVDYSTRGSRPAGSSCGDGALAGLDYQLLVSVRGGKPKRQQLSFTPLPCGVTIADQERFNTSAFPELDLSK